MLMGCFYGPYIYVVLPLGGLYLAADGLLLHAVRGGGHGSLEQACQTGGPRAACGPIGCSMRPAAILLDLKITLIN